MAPPLLGKKKGERDTDPLPSRRADNVTDIREIWQKFELGMLRSHSQFYIPLPPFCARRY